MEVRILGAHQCQTVNQHFTSILIDDWLALDAGSLASALTLEEQLRITDLLITHQHWDHLKDVGGFGYNLLTSRQFGRTSQTSRVYCTAEVKLVMTQHLLAEHFWMNFFAMPLTSNPVFTFQETGPTADFELRGYRIRAIPVPHSVPVQGYEIVSPGGGAVYFTGDNGEGCGKQWAQARPDVLITECTYSDEYVRKSGGKLFGHLSPSLVRGELETFHSVRGYLPRVLIVHVNPFSEVQIREELAEVARDLGASIEVASEGRRVKV